MSGFLARRISSAVVSFAGITLAVFLLIHLAPGDPVRVWAGLRPGAPVPESLILELRHEHGLDRPLAAQYGEWLIRLIQFDLGTSIRHRRPVTDVVMEKLPATLALSGLSFLLALGLAVPAGIWAAGRIGSAGDRALGMLAFVLYSVPVFWLALLLIDAFSIQLRVFPLLGMSSAGSDALTLPGRVLDRLWHLALPSIVLAYGQFALFSRLVRGAVAQAMGEEYVLAARARGVGRTRALWHHAFRNAVLPLLSLLSIVVPMLLSGSVIVEQIFQWDGIGRLFFSAIQTRDYPLVLGLTVLTAAATLLASTLADLAVALVDPRIRFGRSQ
ncbi:MAG: ABC transporter permease [Thermoanaerobaculia bacterium]